MAPTASTVVSFGYASEVLMLLVCGMILASGVVNMELYNRVGGPKGSTADEKKSNADYMDMSNTMFAVDTSVGAVLAAVILALMTYQVGKKGGAGGAGAAVDSSGFKGAVYVQHIFAFLSYIVLTMNSAYGLNVYKKAATFHAKGQCAGTKIGDRTQMSPAMMRQRAMMAARARAMGASDPAVDDQAAVKYASNVNNTNIAFIVISSVFFAVYIGYLGYSSGYFKKGGGIAGGAYSEFFTY